MRGEQQVDASPVMLAVLGVLGVRFTKVSLGVGFTKVSLIL
jgi:hypothetical protein